MKLAANLSLLFTEQPLIERVAAAAAAGFEAVEIQFPYELPATQLQAALQAAGLPLLLINLPAADLLEGGPGLAALPPRQAEFDRALEQALAYAAIVRPRAVNVLAGRLVEGVSREVAEACLVRNLRRCAEAFASLGVRVLVEAINPLDMPGFLITTPAQQRALIVAVGHENLAAQLDLYHMARQGFDSVDCIAQLAGHIGHVQFADCPGRGAPGSGALDFAAALRALRMHGYSGALAAEYRPGEAGTAASLGWLADWRECLPGH